MKPYRTPLVLRLEHTLTVVSTMLVVWVLLGRPNLRLQLLALTRKGLRAASKATGTGAQAVEDHLLDIAKRNAATN